MIEAGAGLGGRSDAHAGEIPHVLEEIAEHHLRTLDHHARTQSRFRDGRYGHEAGKDRGDNGAGTKEGSFHG